MVVVGYGTQKKVNLTGSVDVISNEMLEDRHAANVSQLLIGTSPGLNLDLMPMVISRVPKLQLILEA